MGFLIPIDKVRSFLYFIRNIFGFIVAIAVKWQLAIRFQVIMGFYEVVMRGHLEWGVVLLVGRFGFEGEGFQGFFLGTGGVIVVIGLLFGYAGEVFGIVEARELLSRFA